jgi:transcriptional regulator with XRE-family HTH domain
MTENVRKNSVAVNPKPELAMEKTLAARLKTLRGSLSQAEFASKIGLIQQTYANYESGRAEPSVEKILKISRIFSVSTDWLFGLDDTKPPDKPPSPPSMPSITSDELAQLIQQNTELSHAARDLGASHKQLIQINAELSKELVEMCKEARKSNVAAPVSNVQHGGGRAKTA